MIGRVDSYKIIDYVLKQTDKYEAEILISGIYEGLTRFANSTIHQNVFEDNITVNIKLRKDNKNCEISTNDFTENGLDNAIEQAKENILFAPSKDNLAKIVEKPLLSELDTCKTELNQKYNVKNRALHLKDAFSLLPQNYLAFGKYSLITNLIAYGNSNNVKRYLKSNYVKLNTLISDNEDGTAFYSTLTQKASEINLKSIFQKTLEKAKRNKNRISIEPGEYTVILEPAAVADILMYLAFAGFSAKSVQDNYSFLSNKLGEKVFDERVNITDNWHNRNTMPLPFDLEGYERKKLNIIENGIAKDLAYDSFSAMKDGKKSTGHSVGMSDRGAIPLNIVMQEGERTLDEIIKDTTDAILISRFHYMNMVNPRNAQLTALTRDGLFQIKNGEINNALSNMRFTDSVLDLFNNIIEISKDRSRIPTLIGNYYVPSIKIKKFKFTGATKIASS